MSLPKYCPFENDIIKCPLATDDDHNAKYTHKYHQGHHYIQHGHHSKQYQLTTAEKYLNDPMTLLIKEMRRNGFEEDLFIGNQRKYYGLLDIARSHSLTHPSLRPYQVLSILVYTGCDANYDLCKSQRENNYKKWKMLDKALIEAIHILHKKQSTSYKSLYSGIKGVKIHTTSVNMHSVFVLRTFMSTSVDRDVALEFAKPNGMMIKMGPEYIQNAVYADVSMFSKHPYEKEILLCRNVKDCCQNCSVNGSIASKGHISDNIQGVFIK
eukprot:203357_1